MACIAVPLLSTEVDALVSWHSQRRGVADGFCGFIIQVAIKFESTKSKGCNHGGPPYEWQVYNKITGCYGIPKIYAKGTQHGFHIMVRPLALLWKCDSFCSRYPYEKVICYGISTSLEECP